MFILIHNQNYAAHSFKLINQSSCQSRFELIYRKKRVKQFQSIS